MRREELGDLTAFLTIAEERSFTRAAARLGTSQSALSYTLRRLETRLGVRLLTRTTRSVAATEAGERLLGVLSPAIDSIETVLAALNDFRETPAGSFRITADQYAIDTILWPILSKLLRRYPDIKVELIADSALTDIVAERYDAGVRLGEQVEKDMIAVRIGPEARMIVVAAPSCFENRAKPLTPRDLTHHPCINLRLASYGGFYAWEFEKHGDPIKVRVEGQLAFNVVGHMLTAALEGYGLAYLPEDVCKPAMAERRLVQVLEDWCPLFPGYHLYYPSRRQPTPAFSVILDELRYRA